MNQNRPFYSTNTNLYNEAIRSSAPTTLNGENVILSQEQQRQIYDIFNTSIIGNPFAQQISVNPPVLWAQKHVFPGGVTFTFGPPVIYQTSAPVGSCNCPMSASVPNINHINSFFPSSVEFPQVQAAFNTARYFKPTDNFRLTFHKDRCTSSSDLFNHTSASQGLPDLSCLNGLQQSQRQTQVDCHTSPELCHFPGPPVDFSSNARKLFLTSKCTPDKPPGHVVDVLTEENKKTVGFLDSTTSEKFKDEEVQFSNDCVCDSKKCKKDASKKRTNKQASPKSSSDSADPSTGSDLSESEDQKKSSKKKKSWWKRQEKKSKQDSSDSHSSDNDSKDKRAKKKKKKSQKSDSDDSRRSTSSQSQSSPDCSCP